MDIRIKRVETNGSTEYGRGYKIDFSTEISNLDFYEANVLQNQLYNVAADSQTNPVSAYVLNNKGISISHDGTAPIPRQYIYIGGRGNGKSLRAAQDAIRYSILQAGFKPFPSIDIKKIIFAGKGKLTDTIVIFSDDSKTKCSILNEKGKIISNWDEAVGVMVCIAKRFGLRKGIDIAVDKEWTALRKLSKGVAMSKQAIWSNLIVNEAKDFYGVRTTQRLTALIEKDINEKSVISLKVQKGN